MSFTTKLQTSVGNTRKIISRLLIDVERSKRECPIDKTNEALKSFGGRVVKRIIINLDKIYFNNTMRKHGNPPGHSGDIKTDYETNGFRHTEPPIVVVRTTDGNNRGYLYMALSGHNRVQALEAMGETAYICDVVEFDTKLGESEYADFTNGIHPPSIRGTKADLINRLTKDCNEGKLARTLEAVTESLLRRAPSMKTKKKERDTIINEVIGRIQPYEDFRTYYSDARIGSKGQEFENTTGTAGDKFGIPFFGDKNKKITEVGYIRKGFSKSTAGDLRKLLVKYTGQSVYVTFYIEAPKDGPNSLENQRKGILADFKSWIADEKLYTATKLGVSINDPVMDGFSIPFIVTGFLPQDITKDPSKGGNPKEETLVDVKGNPIKDWRKGIKF